MQQKTCFVIIGFGKKMDYATGREIDLDKTFLYIIKPVFEELGFICFRASDIKHSGVIDLPMYENILKADFVVADISTLNPNVLYELGVRHAVRKNATIIISEEKLKYPFDLSHILIDRYEHLGSAIDFGEVNRFRAYLKEKIIDLNSAPRIDSPLYSLFPNLQTPFFTAEEIEKIKENITDDGSLSDIMTAAEEAKNSRDYKKAIELLNKALLLNQDNKLVYQRLVLATYKAKLPDVGGALFKALEILDELDPVNTTDLETLGLGGAIYKRLYEEFEEDDFLQKSLWFYEKGFYIGSDYYNGINLAFLYNIYALKSDDKFEAFASYGNAIKVRKIVKNICETIRNENAWENRADKEWICLTLAETYFSSGDDEGEKLMIEEAMGYSNGNFSIDSYEEQKQKIDYLLNEFKNKYNI